MKTCINVLDKKVTAMNGCGRVFASKWFLFLKPFWLWLSRPENMSKVTYHRVTLSTDNIREGLRKALNKVNQLAPYGDAGKSIERICVGRDVMDNFDDIIFEQSVWAGREIIGNAGGHLRFRDVPVQYVPWFDDDQVEIIPKPR